MDILKSDNEYIILNESGMLPKNMNDILTLSTNQPMLQLSQKSEDVNNIAPIIVLDDRIGPDKINENITVLVEENNHQQFVNGNVPLVHILNVQPNILNIDSNSTQKVPIKKLSRSVSKADNKNVVYQIVYPEDVNLHLPSNSIKEKKHFRKKNKLSKLNVEDDTSLEHTIVKPTLTRSGRLTKPPKYTKSQEKPTTNETKKTSKRKNSNFCLHCNTNFDDLDKFKSHVSMISNCREYTKSFFVEKPSVLWRSLAKILRKRKSKIGCQFLEELNRFLIILKNLSSHLFIQCNDANNNDCVVVDHLYSLIFNIPRGRYLINEDFLSDLKHFKITSSDAKKIDEKSYGMSEGDNSFLNAVDKSFRMAPSNSGVEINNIDNLLNEKTGFFDDDIFVCNKQINDSNNHSMNDDDSSMNNVLEQNRNLQPKIFNEQFQENHHQPHSLDIKKYNSRNYFEPPPQMSFNKKTKFFDGNTFSEERSKNNSQMKFSANQEKTKNLIVVEEEGSDGKIVLFNETTQFFNQNNEQSKNVNNNDNSTNYLEICGGGGGEQQGEINEETETILLNEKSKFFNGNTFIDNNNQQPCLDMKKYGGPTTINYLVDSEPKMKSLFNNNNFLDKSLNDNDDIIISKYLSGDKSVSDDIIDINLIDNSNDDLLDLEAKSDVSLSGILEDSTTNQNSNLINDLFNICNSDKISNSKADENFSDDPTLDNIFDKGSKQLFETNSKQNDHFLTGTKCDDDNDRRGSLKNKQTSKTKKSKQNKKGKNLFEQNFAQNNFDIFGLKDESFDFTVQNLNVNELCDNLTAPSELLRRNSTSNKINNFDLDKTSLDDKVTMNFLSTSQNNLDLDIDLFTFPTS